jgi:hypothetical protein
MRLDRPPRVNVGVSQTNEGARAVTPLQRITRRDPGTMSLACVDGRRITDVDASAAPSCWVFHLGSDCRLTAEGLWRLIKDGRVVVAGIDHLQWFGLPAPFDARQRTIEAIGSAAASAARYDPETGDLRIEFSGGARLEVITHSSGYESWTLSRPDGTQLVAVGGGEVVLYGPEGAG